MLDYDSLIEKYGSPLYVYNLEEITKSYQKLKNSLPNESRIYYSLKANPNPEVTKHLINLGCYAEISSIGELDTILEIGELPEKCLYTGPGKTRKEIQYALSKDVSHFSVESLNELEIIDDLTNDYDKLINITLRINPSFTVGNASIKMTGVPSQFGFDEELINCNIIEVFKNNKNIKINGFHIYNGSNFHDIDILEENYIKILKTILNLNKKLLIDIEFIDFGGGFAAPFGKEGKLPDYKGLKGKLEILINKHFSNVNRPIIAFESGRYLTATCGCLIGTVQSVKESKGKKFCIVDFGINHLGGMSGLRRIPTIELNVFKSDMDNINREEMDSVTIVGPLCTPLDYLAKNINVSKLQTNDIVVVPNVGAYGLTASLLAFLSREIPREIIIKNQSVIYSHNIKIIREVKRNG
ncbi:MULTISPECIES: decarboxylase [Bacillus]|uniref:decarboxylase n=1 Tax=Bacillus TaxID=1386 RepID=UPI000BF17D1E|nr:decarboxylase [Bacillus wiedmannii]PEM24412.1 decarboxylase [Bacillus wiedmannii]PFM45748.1 decarboxylase [Bacillus cereus]PGS20355.1 decarboxylase [Bacillus cereus]